MLLGLLIKLCVVAVAMLIVSYLMKGVTVRSFGSAFVAAIILGLANAVTMPILKFLTSPINWLTLGLFHVVLGLLTFVINGILFKLVAELVDGLEVRDWASAIIGSILISLVSNVMTWVLS